MTSKSDNLRYSIIPARAITDRAVTAQALRVLALLGRHTDDNGWCRRSQVKMAEELGCSRGTIQNALDLLIGAVNGEGYVERREETRAGVAPEEGRHPHCSYSYRVRLDLDDAAVAKAKRGANRIAPVRANLLAPDGANQEARGANPEKHPVPTSLAPLIEPSPCERTPHEQSGAHESDAPLKAKPEKPASRYPEGFERFWTEVRNHWPGDSAANKHAAANAWGVLLAAGDLRPVGDMVAAARTEGRNRQSAVDQAAKRRERAPYAKGPANWLLLKCFVGMIDEPAHAHGGAAKTFDELVEQAGIVRVTIAPEHVDGLRAQGLDDATIAVWFGDAELIDEPPMVRAGTQKKATTIAERYRRHVAAVLGVEPEFVTFEYRQERAA